MKRIILSLCISALLFSCSSDDDNQIINTQEDNFYALKVSNSWVYKNYKRNLQTNNYDYTGVIDSISIVSTQEINQQLYYKFRTWTTGNENNITYCSPNGESFELLRDSLGYLVTDGGVVKYANNDTSERVLSVLSWGTIYAKLTTALESITTEAGVFNCIDTEIYARDQNNATTPGLDHYYYSDGMGLIMDTTSFVSDNQHSVERRLDSYSVQ